MVKEEQKSITQLVGMPYVLEIMESLSMQPRRFVDLSDACSNEKTRTIRLRELEGANLVETVSVKVGKELHSLSSDRERRFIAQRNSKN